MANSELYGKKIGTIPDKVLNFIKKFLDSNENADKFEKYNQAKAFLNNPELSYSQAKKLKNFFDKFNHLKDEKENFNLLGGRLMKNFIDNLLDSNRNTVIRRKKAKDIVFDNQFRKSHNKTFNKAQQLGVLTNFKTNNKFYMKEEKENLEKQNAAIGFIFNDENKLLIVQRSEKAKWMPMKWGLVGGMIEEGEEPEEAFIREANEETSAELENIEHVFDKEENKLNVSVFTAKCINPEDIELNDEHNSFKWINIEDLYKFNTVPNLLNDLEKFLENKEDVEETVETDEKLEEGHSEFQNYMFFNNLKTIHHAISELLEMDTKKVDELLSNGHNWAVDHLTSATDDIEEVYHFLEAELNNDSENEDCGCNHEEEEEYGMVENIDYASKVKMILDEDYERTKNGKLKYRDELFDGFNKPKRAPKGSKYKYRVLAKDGDKISIVNFGARGYQDFLQHKDKKRRKNFRARMRCDLKYSKLTAKYWVCNYNW
jgi:8-oxo-dGTP diphosphatase